MVDDVWTSRALVRAALRFEPAPRVPRQLWVLPWASQRYADELAAIQRDFPPDIAGPAYQPPPSPRVRGDRHARGTFVDEWGCVFENLCDGVVGEVKDPLVGSYKTDLDKVHPPAELIGTGLERVNESCAASDKFMLAGPGINPFERMQWLRGAENLLMDIAEQSPGLFALRDRVHEYNMAVLRPWLSTDVDGISFSDDWGSQRALLIRPELWRRIFKPLYRDYVGAIRAAGKFAFMHSDGHIFAIYEDLIEIGVSAINSQLFCMDIEEIGRGFKGRITFWGEICRQHVLPFATPEEVRLAVGRVAGALYDGQGGVIGQCEFGAAARPENVRAVFEAWDAVSGRSRLATGDSVPVRRT